ncbi:MAG: hypothetical protein HPY61_01680 [Methanotrichaceae archaeon]|nr:hypothetical protein [Methanotrichaceae archaeon]
MPSPKLHDKFWQIIRLKLYIAGLIVALLALDLIVVLVMACFTHFLIIGVTYLGMTDESAIQVILRISNAIYIIIYLFFGALFVYTIAQAASDVRQCAESSVI